MRAGAIVVAAALAAGPVDARAEEPGATPAAPAPGRFSAGIRIGAGQALLGGLAKRADVESDRATFALAVGGVGVVWAGWVGVQAEALLAKRGALVDLVSEDRLTSLDVRVDLTYLDLDLLVRLQPDRTLPTGVFAVFGPALAIALDDDAPFEVAPFDVGLTGGGGVALGPAGRSFTAELRGSVGLRDVSDEPGAKVRNLSLLLLAGFEL
jgi:hypothetical protein